MTQAATLPPDARRLGAPPLDTLQDVRGVLGAYCSILLIGPQRSGTTIGARMLAHDLGCRYVDEQEHGNHRDRVIELLRDERVVVQAPVMSGSVHELPTIKRCAVVWMLRDREEVIASMHRVHWAARYEAQLVEDYATRWPSIKRGRINDMRLEAWRRFQREAVEWNGLHTYELNYGGEYVQGHPMHVAKPERAGWHVKRWRLEPGEPK